MKKAITFVAILAALGLGVAVVPKVVKETNHMVRCRNDNLAQKATELEATRKGLIREQRGIGNPNVEYVFVVSQRFRYQCLDYARERVRGITDGNYDIVPSHEDDPMKYVLKKVK